jgi:hypothetical protein
MKLLVTFRSFANWPENKIPYMAMLFFVPIQNDLNLKDFFFSESLFGFFYNKLLENPKKTRRNL